MVNAKEDDHSAPKNENSQSPMSDFDEVYEVALSPSEMPNFDEDSSPSIYVSGDSDNEDYSCEEIEVEEKEEEHDKSSLSKKGFASRSPCKWSPKIESVSHISRDKVESTVENESDNLVLVQEDEIKQEIELFNENDDPCQNDLQKSIFAEYPNLKISDEFTFTSCTIKLEKMDFSDWSNANTPTATSSIKLKTARSTSKNTQSSTHNNRPQKVQSRTRKSLRRRSKKQKAKPTKSRKVSETKNKRSTQRSKNEEKQFATIHLRKKTKTISKSTDQTKSRKRSRYSGAIASGDDDDADFPMSSKKQKVSFIEANGSADSRKSQRPKYVNLSQRLNSNSSKSKTNESSPRSIKKPVLKLSKCDNHNVKSSRNSKHVRFVNINGVSPQQVASVEEEELKDPAEDYRKAIAKYLSEVDNYKMHLKSWYECLCCDRKYHTLEQCKEHVRGHFPGMLTN